MMNIDENVPDIDLAWECEQVNSMPQEQMVDLQRDELGLIVTFQHNHLLFVLTINL